MTERSLNSFPELVLESITGSLAFEDIFRMLLTGDGVLKAKFRQGGVREVIFRDGDICVPSCLSSFPELTSFEYSAGDILFGPSFGREDAKLLPKNLKKLILDVSPLFCDFRSIAPSLTFLSIGGLMGKHTSTDLWHFPQTLSTFKITMAVSLEIFPILDLLPSGLTSLQIPMYSVDLRKKTITNGNRPFTQLSKLVITSPIGPTASTLPKNLTCLKMNLLHSTPPSHIGATHMPWADFPKNIIFLKIEVCSLSLTPQDVLLFNRGMKKLSITTLKGLHQTWTAEVVAGLPRNLEKLNLLLEGLNTKPFPSPLIQSLPTSLKQLTCSIDPSSLRYTKLQMEKLETINFRKILMTDLGVLPSSLTSIEGLFIGIDSLVSPGLLSPYGLQYPNLLFLRLILTNGRCGHVFNGIFPSSLRLLDIRSQFGWFNLNCVPKQIKEVDFNISLSSTDLPPPSDWLHPISFLPLTFLRILGVFLSSHHLETLKAANFKNLERLVFFTLLPLDQATKGLSTSITHLTITSNPPYQWKEAIENISPNLEHFNISWASTSEPRPKFDASLVNLLPRKLKRLHTHLWGNSDEIKSNLRKCKIRGAQVNDTPDNLPKATKQPDEATLW